MYLTRGVCTPAPARNNEDAAAAPMVHGVCTPTHIDTQRCRRHLAMHSMSVQSATTLSSSTEWWRRQRVDCSMTCSVCHAVILHCATNSSGSCAHTVARLVRCIQLED